MSKIVCHCGTTEEATRIAEKMFVDMVRSDCPVWAFAVGTALKTICIQHLAKASSMKDIQQASNEIVAEVKKTMRDDLYEEALKKKAELYGDSG